MTRLILIIALFVFVISLGLGLGLGLASPGNCPSTIHIYREGVIVTSGIYINGTYYKRHETCRYQWYDLTNYNGGRP